MNQKFRILIVTVLIMSILYLAGNQVVWAGKSPHQGPSIGNNDWQSIAANRGNADDDDGGSVKPPPKVVIITKSGTYSIGGFCTLTITLTSPDVKAVVHIERPLPDGLPDDFQRIRQACHVTYYQSNKQINELTPNLGNATICFAAIPKKQMKIFLYNIGSRHPTWSPVETTIDRGIACGPANFSGVYVGTFKKH